MNGRMAGGDQGKTNNGKGMPLPEFDFVKFQLAAEIGIGH